jgi:hypothetical protein
MNSFPSYAIVAGESGWEQGDFLQQCPILVPVYGQLEEEGQELDLDVREYNVIVLSQSCDLEQGRLDNVLVCPVWKLSRFGEKHGHFATDKGKEGLRRGYHPAYHMLNRCELPGFELEHCVVDFRNVYGVPADYLTAPRWREVPRLRLLPPYREHLSQAFARFFMRVGLPSNIPQFR